MAQGSKIWDSVVTRYFTTMNPLVDATRKKLDENNAKAMNSILFGLVNSNFTKVMQCESTKEMWGKLQNMFEGDDKVKEAKLQTFRSQFEGLKMKEDENIVTFFLRVDGVVKSIRGLGEKLEESIVVKKVLRSLPDRHDPKVSALEEYRELKTLKMDELQGVLIDYEMRKERYKPSRYITTFKESKREEAHQASDYSKEDSDEEEENFMRNLKKGSRKYEGKFPFKCFDCGRIGHLSSKFPRTNKNKKKEEYEHKRNKNQYESNKGKRKKNYKDKIHLYA